MKRILLINLSILIFSARFAVGQKSVYGEKIWTDKVDSALNLIYNLEFEKAALKIKEIEVHLGEHPAVLLLKAESVFWKYRPLKKNTQPYNEYMGLLNRVIEETSTQFPDDQFEMEKNFYLMSGYSLLTEQLAEDKDYWSVLSTSKNAYKYLKNGMGHEKEIPDYYFTTGLYNYYRVEYPLLHPFYKPFLWFFMDGDKKLGIDYLIKASKLSLFLKEQAYLYLFHIYLRYEYDPKSALPYARFLAENYPNNLRFASLFTEALYYNKEFNKMETYTDTLSRQQNKFYTIPGYLFKGLLAEHNKNIEEAKKYFNFSLSQTDDNEGEDDHYVAMDYAGLARIAILENKPEEAKNYYKLAAKTEPYIPVKQEAEAYLEKDDQ